MNVQEEINSLIKSSLASLGVSLVDFVLEHPADMDHGDYACNIAMIAAKKLQENPRELAARIVDVLPEHEYIERTEVAGPGFVNFYLSQKFFADALQDIVSQKDGWGGNELLSGKKVMVEYTDPNPFKELHIGHLVPNSIGVALARIARASGAEVREVTFQGDVGMHVAKAIYGMQELGLTVESNFTAADLGKAYAVGATAFEDSETAKQEIEELNKRIYAVYREEEIDLKELYEKGKDVSIKYFEEVYKLLGSNFEHYFFESESGPVGIEIVRANIGKVFEESQGAVVFKGEEYGLHTRVFINKQGLPTYEAKDVGLVRIKQEWWPHDTSITVTGAEQESYFKVVQKSVELIEPEMAKPMTLVANGMLDLKNGKMSSRTGDVVRALDLVKDVKGVVSKKMQDASDEDITAVAVGAIKYSILKSGTSRNIMFDFDSSISFEGDSGPYLQYTYARCKSVLNKAGEFDMTCDGSSPLDKVLYRFSEVVERSAAEYEPHYIAHYLNELASSFNSWYAQEHILDGSDAQNYKLTVTSAVAQTIKNALWMLGIKAPDKM